MPYKKRKKPLRGPGVVSDAMCPIRPNVLWAADFQFDQTRDGRMLKFLNHVDEHTRECLAIRVDRSIDADDVVATLDKIAGERGFPVYVRFDNGPEFVAHAVADWCRLNGARVASQIGRDGSPRRRALDGCWEQWLQRRSHDASPRSESSGRV